MESRILTVGGVVVAALWLAGCDGGQKAMSVAEPAGPALSPHGQICAGRTGGKLTVEVALAGIPEDVKMIAMGMKLPGGEVVRPGAVAVLNGPTHDLDPSPRVGFSLAGDGGAPTAAARPELCLQVMYDLPAGAAAADGCVFSLSLGDPGDEMGCRMGVAAAVSTQGGDLLPVDYSYVQPADRSGGDCPLPPAPESRAKSMSFRLKETPGPAAAGAAVSIRPVVVPASPAGASEPVALGGSPDH